MTFQSVKKFYSMFEIFFYCSKEFENVRKFSKRIGKCCRTFKDIVECFTALDNVLQHSISL